MSFKGGPNSSMTVPEWRDLVRGGGTISEGTKSCVTVPCHAVTRFIGVHSLYFSLEMEKAVVGEDLEQLKQVKIVSCVRVR